MDSPNPIQIINGNRYDFSSIEANVDGQNYLGFKSINYGHSLEPGEAWGTSAQHLGRTRGQYKPEASFEMYLEEYSFLIAQLGDGYMESYFDINVHYEEDGVVITDQLLGFRIKKAEKSHSQGSEPLTVKVDGTIRGLIENGVAPLNGMVL